MFISVHIPKTAGTTLAQIFDHASERRVMFDYSADYSNTLFDDVGRERFLNALPFIKSHFRFIHGHFYLEKYLDIVPDAKFITCFRKPVERVVSQFRHIWYEGNPNSPLISRIENGFDIVDFASGDFNVANAHRKHLGDRDPSDLDFIFINERLSEGLGLFQKMFQGAIQNQWALSVPRVNDGDTRETKSARPTLKITQQQIDALAPILADETSYYDLAVSRYEENLRKF